MTEKKQRFGNAEPAEFIRENGKLKVRPGIRLGFTRCFTCNNMCGLRYRVDEATDKITRLLGNPYCEVSSGGSPLPLDVPVREAYEKMAEEDCSVRATICGKGACALDGVDDPNRVTQVLKRAGKRGEDKWVTISYEQALEEIVEGGDLFGEGHVDGLRAIRDIKTPVVPGYPEFGPKSNQLLVGFLEEDNSRSHLLRRFVCKSFGSSNFMTKHSYCGVANEVGCALALMPRIHEHMGGLDWENFEYALFIGTSPGSSGHSLNKQGKMIAEARVKRKVKYACVDPILRTAVANNADAKWIGILPGSDTAFLYGVMKSILDNGWECKNFLEIPNRKAAEKANEVNWSNSTHLIDLSTGKMADAFDYGIGPKGNHVVSIKGELRDAESVSSADLYVESSFKNTKGETRKLISSMQFLKNRLNRHTLPELSERCKASVNDIQEVAYELTHHNRRAATVMFIGNYGEDAVISSWCITLINTLIGSQDRKGGATYTSGWIKGYTGSYNLDTFDGCITKAAQMNICRDQPYETSTEYKKRIEKGENPYPAQHLYHNMTTFYTAQNAADMLLCHLNKDPYEAKCWLLWKNNPIYSASSLTPEVEQRLRDPKVMPLIVSIDAFINETNRNADYIIPDLVNMEEYAADRTWGNLDQCITAGVPVVTPRTVINKKGRHVCMEEFIIDVALKLKLPGFGKEAIPTSDGRKVDLLSFDDWHARLLSNLAEKCTNLPTVTDEDRDFAALNRAMKQIAPRLTKEQASKVEALLSRGGYYVNKPRYIGENLANSQHYFLQIYNPAMVELHHCYTGETLPPVPDLREQRFFTGEVWSKYWSPKEFPLKFSTYKPTMRSNWSAAYDHCIAISPKNFIHMNEKTASQFGLQNGDRIRVISPNGAPVEGQLKADAGVVEGAVMIAHTFGHWAYGSENRIIDGKEQPKRIHASGGVAVNRLFPTDPTRKDQYHSLYDSYAGTFARAGVPVKVEKIV